MVASRKFLQPINPFNGSIDPVTAVQGDFYYNTSIKRIKYYDGSSWQIASGIYVSDTPPLSPLEGNTWFKNTDGSFYIWDGTYWQEAGIMSESSLIYDANPTLAANLDANGFNVQNINNILFDVSPVGDSASGTLMWDSGKGTLDIGLKGGNITLPIGQQEVLIVYNASASTLAKGSVVYIDGSYSQIPTVSLAKADSPLTSKNTIGVVSEPINASSSGYVTTFGIVDGLNTIGLSEGNSLWLSSASAGKFTDIKPTNSSYLVKVGLVINSSSVNGKIFVQSKINSVDTQGRNIVSSTAPLSPELGDMWYDTNTGKQYIWYDSYWVEEAAVSNPSTVQIGTVTSIDPSQQATVTNSGTSQNAVLNFRVPRGSNAAPLFYATFYG